MGECNRRAQCAEVDRVFLVVNSVCICLINLVCSVGMLLHILLRNIIHGEDAVLSARLDRHICNGKAVVHGQIRNAVPNKFHRLI